MTDRRGASPNGHEDVHCLPPRLAPTEAECAEGSIHRKYVSQFQWVRSYVLENGHLFLATMADGSIIEFEPMTALNR